MTIQKSHIPSSPPPPSVIRKKQFAHYIGLGLMCFWALIGLSALYMLIIGFDIGLYVKYGTRLLVGLLMTVKLVALSIIIGAILALPVTYMRLSSNFILAKFSFGYSYFFRGTPLLAQTFLVYYGAGEFRHVFQDLGLWWFFRDAFNVAVFTFSLNTAAYQSEILKGAIKSVPRGQYEGAQSLGIPKPIAFIKIILPQALITALRPLGNEIILMIKGSAIASVITVLDLMGQTRYAFSRTFDFQMYIWAALIYLTIVEALRRAWDKLEIRLTKHLKR